jgi:CheY-like chemotaxis protein
MVKIFIVEDNRGDAKLLEEAFLDNGADVSLNFAKEGREALTILRREKSLSPSSKPDLIVLDLKMPGMDGLSFLREIKTDPSLASIPIIVLTGSDAPEDWNKAFSLGARCYFTKPTRLDGWRSLTYKLEEIALAER